MKLDLSRQIFENAQTSNLMTTHLLGVELSYAERDMTKLIVAFRNFANAPKYRYFHDAVSIKQNGYIDLN